MRQSEVAAYVEIARRFPLGGEFALKIPVICRSKGLHYRSGRLPGKHKLIPQMGPQLERSVERSTKPCELETGP